MAGGIGYSCWAASRHKLLIDCSSTAFFSENRPIKATYPCFRRQIRVLYAEVLKDHVFTAVSWSLLQRALHGDLRVEACSFPPFFISRDNLCGTKKILLKRLCIY
jgi:hypothetical protein